MRTQVGIIGAGPAGLMLSGKGNKERTVPVSAEARRGIERYLEERSDELEPLFISNYHNRISARTVKYIEIIEGLLGRRD
jgi:site-specific recombinase XerC